MSWTDERVALLTKLWGEGKTAAEIASALGGVTRNAVIGKAHRLKLSNRVSPIQQNKKPAPVKVERKKAEPMPVKDKADGQDGVALTDLGANMCRWPYGDPRDEGFGFCGEESISGIPYCEEHAKAAYQAASRNRILQAKEFEDKQEADAAAEERTKEEVKAAVGR